VCNDWVEEMDCESLVYISSDWVEEMDTMGECSLELRPPRGSQASCVRQRSGAAAEAGGAGKCVLFRAPGILQL